MRDLVISRTTFDWPIPLTENAQVMLPNLVLDITRLTNFLGIGLFLAWQGMSGPR